MDLNNIENQVENIQDPFDTSNRKPMFSFLGFSDLSVLDWTMGFASGVFQRNVKDEWHQCLGSPLVIFRDIVKLSIEFSTQDFTNIVGVITNLVLVQHIANLVVKIFTELPKDL